jgi:hypothetical protein
MYDPLMEYKEGAADDEVLQQFEDDRQRDSKDIQLLNQQAETTTKESAPAQPAAQQAPTSEPAPAPEPQAEQQEKEVSENFLDRATEALQPAMDAFQAGRELGMAPAAGTVDFLIDTVNMVPQVNIPKATKYQNQYAQASRELSSFIIPNLVLAKTGIGAGVAANNLAKLKVGQSALVKLLGTAGVETGTGVVVDYINANSTEGDNVQGTLKKLFPETFSWISNDWATIDSDSPELKRAKSINEGVGLGMFTAFLEAGGQLLRGIKGTTKETRFIAGTDTEEAFFKDLELASYNTPEEAFANAVVNQEEALDEIGAYMLSKRTNLDETLSGEMPRPREFQDTRGQGKFYHGASKEFELVPGGQYAGEKNIYGAGLYVTDDFETASSYKPKNRAKGVKKADAAEQGVVYEVDMSKQNLFDLDGPAQQYFIDFLKESKYDAMDELIERAIEDVSIDAAQRGVMPTTAQFMDEMRGYSRSLEVPSYEITEVFEQYQDILKKKGFTGYKHKGGMKAGKGKRQHEVAIIFNPDETSSINKVNQEDLFAPATPARTSEPILGVHDAFDPAESGVRTVDNMGVIGASVDAVRTQNNIDSHYGRLGSVVSEAALKYGLEADQLPKRTIVKAVVDSIKKGGKYSAELASGKRVSFDQIDEAGSNLADILADPRMDTGTIKGILDEFKDEYQKLTGQAKSLSDVGYNAAMKTIKKYLDDFVEMDTQKASAYLATSMAGQVSDMAEGARYMEDTPAVARAQEMILDRLEYLFVEKGLASYNKSTSLNFLNTWKRFRDDPKVVNQAAKDTIDETNAAYQRIIGKAKNSANSLRAMAKERPQYLVPLQMAWEFSDGNIDTLSKLNNFVEQSLPAIGKAFFNGQPQIPNQIVQGAWSTIYNSILTSISTPAKAFFGNTVLMLAKPFSVLGGAAMVGDVKTLKRGWYQYSGVLESMQKGFKHMSEVYGRAARDPSSVSYIMRQDLAVKNDETMNVLHSYARQADAEGNSGPLILYHMAEALNDLGNDPVLRFGANAMTALDGFARAVIANGQARANAYDRFVSGGVSMNPKAVREAQEDIYNKMFDKNGMITNEAVDYASREIALNLDNDGVRALNNFIQQYPAVKPFLMFPRTSANMIAMANKFSPVSIFMDDVNKLANPFAKHTREEIQEILTSKGIPYDNYAMQNFQALKRETLGRKAIGTLTVTGAVGLFLNDRLRGNGHFDKERQRVRNELDYKPRTYKGWDGKWYTYDGLGPISDWLALTADVMDNFDSVTENDLETMLNKMGFILSANLTNKSMLAGLEPMNDVLSGNPAALSRWASSFASAFVPLSGARNELGRIIAPQLRELDMEFTQLIRNRNKWTDLMDPKGALPFKYDWIDGKQVGYAENFFVRAWNATMPMKVSDGVSDERQFLMDIEYDTRPLFNKNSKGVEYTAEERSELFSKMGELGTLKKEINKIMNSREAQDWKKTLLDERKRFGSADPRQWRNLYNRLDRAIRVAKREAEIELGNLEEIQTRQWQMGVNEIDQRQGKPQRFPLRNR